MGDIPLTASKAEFNGWIYCVIARTSFIYWPILIVTTLKQCFSLAICFQRSSLFNHPKFFGTSPQLWCHKTMYYFLKKTSCPEKPLDLTVLPVKHYFSKVSQKDTTTKAFVLINHCFINFFSLAWRSCSKSYLF